MQLQKLVRYFYCLCLLGAIAPAAESQLTLAVQPFLSYYVPLGRFDRTDLLSTALPEQPSDLRGIAWGADLQLKLGERFAIGGLGLASNTTLPSCSCPGGPTPPSPIHVRIAAIEAEYDLSRAPTRYNLWASAGPAVIRHSGRGYDRPDSPVSWGGALGLELAVPVGHHWQLVTKGTGIGYHFDSESPPQHGPQVDAIMSVGVRWHSGS